MGSRDAPDIRPFFISGIRPDTGYSGRISGYRKKPGYPVGFPVIEKTGYPAGFPVNYAAKEKLLNTTYNIV